MMKSKESGAGCSGLCVRCPPSHVLLNLICHLEAAAVAASVEFNAWTSVGCFRGFL